MHTHAHTEGPKTVTIKEHSLVLLPDRASIPLPPPHTHTYTNSKHTLQSKHTEGPKTVTIKEHSLVILPDRAPIPLPCPDLPELVINVVDAVIVSGIRVLCVNPRALHSCS